MTYGQTLIDKAARLCVSDADLARRLGVTRVAVNRMRHGHLKVSPEMAVLLSAIVAHDPNLAIQKVLIENAPPTRRDQLVTAFRKLLGMTPHDRRAGDTKPAPLR